MGTVNIYSAIKIVYIGACEHILDLKKCCFHLMLLNT